jgi:ECF transporter S component (folate family)
MTETNTSKRQFSTKGLVQLALMLALTVLLMRFSITLPYVNISLTYLPIALTGMLFGPVAGAAVGFLSNELDALLRGFGFNPLYSLIPMLKGLMYGLLLFGRVPGRRQIFLVQALIDIFLHILANTVLLYLFYNKGAFGALPLRILKNVMFFPIEVFTLIKLSEYRGVFLRLTR